jgi:hypothetical protein
MVGETERQVNPQEDRSTSEEVHCSEADEPRHEKEVISLDEGTMGCEEEGWCYGFIEPS